MQTSERRPNVLIFMTDQQRGDSVLPGAEARMPNLARFRGEGVTFSQTFCPSPHCCPSRATFFSGLYPSEHGVWNNVNVPNTLSRGLAPGVRLWSEDFAAAGYALHWTGKWHVSHVEHPADRGWTEEPFASAKGSPESGADTVWAHYAQHAREWNDSHPRAPGEILRPGWPPYTHYGTREDPTHDLRVVESAIASLGRLDRDRPWCLYAGTLGPHDPYYPPQRFLDLYGPDSGHLPENFDDRMADKPGFYRRTRGVFDQLSPDEHRDAVRHYHAYCSYQDWLFGQVLEALDATGQAEDTLVLFCSDHGDYRAEHGLWCKGLPCFRGAYHVPAVIRWPRGIRNPGRCVEHFVSLADVAPTLLEVAGIAADRPMTGASLVPFLRDEPPSTWRDAIYTQTNGNEQYGIQRSVMTRDWKYVQNGFDFDELYDLRDDPGETRNRAADPACADVVRGLCQRLWRFASEHGDTCTNGYIMVGFAPYGPASAFES